MNESKKGIHSFFHDLSDEMDDFSLTKEEKDLPVTKELESVVEALHY